jgi:hypothetical protein
MNTIDFSVSFADLTFLSRSYEVRGVAVLRTLQ